MMDIERVIYVPIYMVEVIVDGSLRAYVRHGANYWTEGCGLDEGQAVNPLLAADLEYGFQAWLKSSSKAA